jgi:L-iditol 2-dehydrogenase
LKGGFAVPDEVRAAVLEAPGKYTLASFPVPTLEPGALLVKNILSGICGTDKHTFQGYTEQYSGAMLPSSTPFPIIQGHENVGEVLEVRGEVRNYDGALVKAGDRVVVGPNVTCKRCLACTRGLPYTLCFNIRDYGNTLSAASPPHLFGGWAEMMYVLPGSFIFPVPDELPDEVAVLTELFAVTVGLDYAQASGAVPGLGFRFGGSVLVYGVGPLGLCYVAKARMMGAGTIIAIDVSQHRLDFSLRMGADTAINAHELSSAEQRLGAVRDLTEGLGADVVVECVGRPEIVPEGLDMLRVGGTFVEAGNFSDLGSVPLVPHRHLCSKGIRLIGVPGQEPGVYGPSMRAMHRYGRELPFHELVSHRFGLADVGAGLERAVSDEARKVVVDPWM